MASPFQNFSDPTTAEGRKLWELAIKPLKNEFDGSNAGYGMFRAGLRNKANLCRWQDILRFPDPESPQNFINLIDNADLIPMEDVADAMTARELLAIETPTAANEAQGIEEITQQQIDQAQKELLQSNMMHECLVNSLTGTLETFIANQQNQALTKNDGPTLLKIIQTKCRGKAVRQSIINVREEIRTLNLKEFRFNIVKFNERLKELINFLVQNEEQYLPQDVANMVTQNYNMVSHDEFKSAIQFHFRDLEQRDVDVDYERLLELGESKYQELVKKKTWGKKTLQEEQLLALQAKVDQLESSKSKVKLPSNDGNPTSSDTPNPKKKNKKKIAYEDWQFKPIEGKSTITKERVYNGEKKQVTYYWCPHHGNGKGMWVRHKPSECKNANKNAGGQPSLVASQVILDEGSQE